MTFTFDSFDFDPATLTASFHYRFDDGQEFTETVQFAGAVEHYNAELLKRALFLAHILVGASYFKTFPTPQVKVSSGKIDAWQAQFFNRVFQEGLSQFAYENNLTRANLAQFQPTTEQDKGALDYNGTGIVALQSGGKDSLLLATMLAENQDTFTPWYITNGESSPKILDDLGQPLLVARRQIDRTNLGRATKRGALNGHVPITYIVESLALIQAILLNKNAVLAAIAHEGEEPRDMIDDLPINHQWSKTWQAEQSLSEYVARYLAPQIQIGSPLRQYSELAVAELFVKKGWHKFGRRFSSCNVANYRQGTDNARLTWCSECAKCANTWVLLAPFVPAVELKHTFGVEQDLFARDELAETFKGLLGIDAVPKPFECVGEIAELRAAYRMAQQREDYAPLGFLVPQSDFDYHKKYEHNGNLAIGY
jgi:hypothetical protein